MKTQLTALVAVALSASAGVHASDIVATSAYRWHGDTITQGEFFATAPNPYEINSTYRAQPGYRMPVSQHWKVKNDISAYPQLRTPNTLHAAIYNLGLDEMVNAVEPDTTLRTGKEWAGVWTRDVSYSILLSMAYMQTEASKVSLMKKVNANGEIIQDTGSGGAWPVSTDRLVWSLAAYEIYKVTGDRAWLEKIYPIIKKSLDTDAFVSETGGLVKGETSFIDWRTQSYPVWMEMTDIYNSEALGTSVVHAQALRVLAEIATELGHKKEAKDATARAQKIEDAVNTELWMDDKGYYAMYNYGRNFNILNPRAETLGESLAILYDVASPERARTITESNPTTPFGTAIFFPQIEDKRPYHNNALWPWVGAYWAMANAKVRNDAGTMEAIGAVFRPAALFTTNKENFVLDNGDIATELNSSNMLWCLAGNIAITHKILFGIHFEKDGLTFSPFVPKALAGERTLENFPYRNASLDITVRGFGSEIKSFTLNGKEHKPFIPANIRGKNTIVITMADNEPEPMKVNRTHNMKAPWTPQTWISDGHLCWRPIEDCRYYIVLRDGKPVAETREVSYKLDGKGEWQVIAVNDCESFASEPRSNRDRLTFQFPGEKISMTSPEVSYQPETPVAGYTGNGFIEVDHNTKPVTVTIDVPEDGEYAVAARYTNGNGPISTENKCALRTLSVNGKRLGTIILPQRGTANWTDWGMSHYRRVHLTKGQHTITVDFRPADENMNLRTNHALLDAITLEKL